MKRSLTSGIDLQLDLSFTGANQDVLAQLSDQPTKSSLIEAAPWEKALREWIHFIRSDNSLHCPESVRKTLVVSMGLQFTDDKNITFLNSTWCGKSEKTDVLSFPIIDDKIIVPKDQSIELGDIVVSLITAEQQAMEQKHTLEEELRWLVSHGLLHLLGWEHPNPQSLKAMLCCQEQLLCIDGNLPTNGGNE
ncbi:rRNA maturation RNase YbeY [Prochlorococcus sp. MIT 1307]|uniref:rRNA maturation RNase YbeY n=1 Tax=Prochlorococcus sp. MIT 1307 TaxID=3096219 RepID=UPI002A751873|nr:rRNA maturation RNase YbeY [Prochlorococcus sp. MIT 1307]